MKFTKMHAAGQDYVVIDAISQRPPRNPFGLALEVSDRQRGVGAQGLIVIEPSETADARMQIFNGYGEEIGTCFHGLRCVAKYLFDHKLAGQDRIRIESHGQSHQVDVTSNSGIAQFLRVDMGSPTLDATKIPTLLSGNPEQGNRVVDTTLDLEGIPLSVCCVALRSPHCVLFVEQLSDDLVLQLGAILEGADVFPDRTSVDFVQVESPASIQQRTWERGLGESPACVEGACAAVVAGVLSGRLQRNVNTRLPGGTLDVEWDEASNHVFSTGSAVDVFSGQWNGLS